MKKIVSFYKSFYLTKLFYIVAGVAAVLFALSFFVAQLFMIAQFILMALGVIVLLDVFVLYAKRNALLAARVCSERLSNGDANKIEIIVKSNYSFNVLANIVEELPAAFYYETSKLQLQNINGHSDCKIPYNITPKKRGEFSFGNTLLFVTSPIKIVKRRFNFPTQQTVFVYPSYMQMQKISIKALSNIIMQVGNKQIRKLGNSTEFEQIKEYVRGDDYRTINWKATARKNQLMVNTYIDEKCQQVYCLIDKSRSMKMPFERLTLLDYAINSSLALSNVALQKQDKVGLLTFAEKIDSFVPADRKPMQMEAIMQQLYKQSTYFKDADFEALYAQVRNKIKQRSLLILFTNFESEHSFKRQLPYLKKIAHYHLLLVVFFENTELKKLSQSTAANTEEIYVQTIAHKFIYEKKLMLKELRHAGITAILTEPANLTVNAVNKYLEIKNKQAL